jgi:hypothetical protein
MVIWKAFSLKFKCENNINIIVIEDELIEKENNYLSTKGIYKKSIKENRNQKKTNQIKV